MTLRVRTLSRSEMSPDAIIPEVLQPMSYADARDLTADLREHLAISGALLLEAYERQAYRALGYATWSDYVKRELTSALSSVQRRLDHTRLVRALCSMGVAPTAVPNVPLVMANEVLRRLPDATEPEPIDAVLAIVESIRARTLPAVTTDEIERVLVRHQATIERAAARVGMAPTAWLERALIGAAQVVGCD